MPTSSKRRMLWAGFSIWLIISVQLLSLSIYLSEAPQSQPAQQLLAHTGFSAESSGGANSGGTKSVPARWSEPVDPEDRLSRIECPVTANSNEICHQLRVPSNYSAPNATQLNLSIAIRVPTELISQIPLLYLTGGPGGSAIDELSSWRDDPLDNRVIILIDQRGTGYSEPSLECDAIPESELTDTLDYNATEVEYLELVNCRD